MLKKMLLVAILFMAVNSAMAESVVIVNLTNANSLDAKIVKRIFLGKEKKFADGNETIAINQPFDSQVRRDFDQNMLGRSSSQVSAYWSKLVFTGKGIPPKEVANDAEVIALVSKNPNVIGYISKASITDAVKAVEL